MSNDPLDETIRGSSPPQFEPERWSEPNFYTDGVTQPFVMPPYRLPDAEPKTLDPRINPDEVLHQAGDAYVYLFGYHEEHVDGVLLILRDITRGMIASLSPPPVDNPKYVYLWVNDELAYIKDQAIALGWCAPLEFDVGYPDYPDDAKSDWQFAATAALFK